MSVLLAVTNLGHFAVRAEADCTIMYGSDGAPSNVMMPGLPQPVDRPEALFVCKDNRAAFKVVERWRSAAIQNPREAIWEDAEWIGGKHPAKVKLAEGR